MDDTTRDALLDAFSKCHALLESVAEQQATPDDSWRSVFADIKRAALSAQPASGEAVLGYKNPAPDASQSGVGPLGVQRAVVFPAPAAPTRPKVSREALREALGMNQHGGVLFSVNSIVDALRALGIEVTTP